MREGDGDKAPASGLPSASRGEPAAPTLGRSAPRSAATESPLRVLVVDDTVTYRQLVGKLVGRLPQAEPIGAAPNGRIALEKIELLGPDLVLLDLEMPEMDGLELLRRLRSADVDVGVIILSGATDAGAHATVEALSLGAFDFIPKPVGGSLEENASRLEAELRPKLEAFRRSRQIRRILRGPPEPRPARGPSPAPATDPQAARPPRVGAQAALPAEVVALGISTGGPQALTLMLPELPPTLPAPLLVVQHMPAMFTHSMAEDLDRRCRLRVREGAEGLPVEPGTIYIAPGGRQMKVARRDGAVAIRITDDPPEKSCRPSVDYLFRSVADVYGGRALGVIMTGMGNDGAEGCHVLKRRGGAVVCQDQASCVVFGMPREPIELGLADAVVPLDRIASEIVRRTQGGAAR